MLMAGDHLVDVEREAERDLEFVEKARFGQGVDTIAAQLGLVRTLRGLTRQFGRFDDEQFQELGAERRFAANPNLRMAECWYWGSQAAGARVGRRRSGGCRRVAAGGTSALEDHVVLATAGQPDRTQKQQHQFEHGLDPVVCCWRNSTGSAGDKILANDTGRVQVKYVILIAEHCT